MTHLRRVWCFIVGHRWTVIPFDAPPQFINCEWIHGPCTRCGRRLR